MVDVNDSTNILDGMSPRPLDEYVYEEREELSVSFPV